MNLKKWLPALLILACSHQAFASGYGVFTQGAKGLGQANAVVAHSTGPSSLYFNPALMTEVPGQQIEVGTTVVSVDRDHTNSLTGQSFSSDEDLSFPSTFYFTSQHDRLTAGVGVYFPFGLSSDWGTTYDGRYIGTSADMFSVNINPAVAYKVSDRLSLAAGFDALYLSADLKNNINQVFAGMAVPPALGGPVVDPTMPDVFQKFDGDGWGAGYNLGLAYKITDSLTFGAAYRSHIDVSLDGDASFARVDPRLALLFLGGGGDSDIRLPQQASAGLAWVISPVWTVEGGVRWEDWSSTQNLVINLDRPVLGQTAEVIPRDWDSTWSYNIGSEYQLNETVTLLAGYLYGESTVPSTTFEPIIPESKAHLFTFGTELVFDAWTLSVAGGYEHHTPRDKNNLIGDPLDPGINPVSFASGKYTTDIYLGAVSATYRF